MNYPVLAWKEEWVKPSSNIRLPTLAPLGKCWHLIVPARSRDLNTDPWLAIEDHVTRILIPDWSWQITWPASHPSPCPRRDSLTEPCHTWVVPCPGLISLLLMFLPNYHINNKHAFHDDDQHRNFLSKQRTKAIDKKLCWLLPNNS